ncbi:MAG: tRNA uridine-5-carboxymethylaminomethyl(34) synthesis GTPase MnmE [Candidatus Cryptobacteroides sp.]|nr:tRNA uridine-5-carboxymethylaminomethyl(34) synthesis GTPase MnmE [Bacteroidales bacterium]MDY5495912.1 tRNA uridine-5-carboxymethylaminomethyl(34) synthesis GTPase MnmE [Candidatus Cryptobacteroides sp.]
MPINKQDTICAPATIPGTGAISVIRLSGPEALSIADKVVTCNGTPLSSTDGYRIRYGTVLDNDGETVDNVLVSVFRAPHSYTGEDSAEICCHASSYIVQTIIGLLLDAGARSAGPGEFTRRAFVNGKMDLAQAEAVADVIAAQDKAAHRVAMNQLKGGYSKELGKLRAKLLKMTSLLELELDFSEEDVEFASRSEMSLLVNDVLHHVSTLASSFKRGNAVKNGLPVAIIGPANSGKSTLLNAIIGEDRAIVSDIAGTTRDTIEEVINVGGVSLRFIDTAGIRDTEETVEKIGIGRSLKKMQEASIILGILDPARGFSSMRDDVQFFLSNVDLSEQKLILVLNKIDLAEGGKEADSGVNKNVIRGNEIVSLIENKSIDIPLVKISAKTGEGLVDLMSTLSNKASDLVGTSDSTLVTNLRHYEALRKSEAPLRRVLSGLGATDHATPLPPDLIAQDLREALHYIGSIVGEISTDEVLGSIFREFCVGK